jgi:hypothetical protein
MSDGSKSASEFSNAMDMFGLGNSAKSKQQAPSPAAKEAPAEGLRSPSPGRSTQETPPPTIATQTTAASSVSSVTQQTPASVVSAVSGRLLNTRPRRDVSVDGVANFVVFACAPSKDKNADPVVTAHGHFLQMFSILKKNDPDLCLYPIWDAEPGAPPLPALSSTEQFPSDLDSMQLYAQLSNPWDVKKVKPGEINQKTGKLKVQKALYYVSLMGTKYDLDHVIKMSYPSISALGCNIRKKDVDALDSATMYGFVGLPNEWDSRAMTAKLYNELERHEEWMQGNVKAGYTAIQHAGEPFPPVLVRRTQVRLPESGDVLSAKENEAIQYAYSLRNLNCLEVSACDKARVEGCFADFRLRGKLTTFSADCDVLPLNVTSRNGSTVRLDWYKGLKAQMNFQFVHEVRYFDGVTCCEYKARGEMDPSFHDGRKAYRNTSFKRELLDIKRPDGKKVFLGAIDATGEYEGKLQVYYFSDDDNEKFVTGICGNLPMFVAAYLKHVKGYSGRSITSILGACSDAYRLGANDYKWNPDTRSIQPLTQINRLSFADKMAQRDMHFLLPEVIASFGNSGAKDKVFSDGAKREVANAFNFKNKPGYNPTPADAASCLSDNSQSTSGALSLIDQ